MIGGAAAHRAQRTALRVRVAHLEIPGDVSPVHYGRLAREAFGVTYDVPTLCPLFPHAPYPDPRTDPLLLSQHRHLGSEFLHRTQDPLLHDPMGVGQWGCSDWRGGMIIEFEAQLQNEVQRQPDWWLLPAAAHRPNRREPATPRPHRRRRCRCRSYRTTLCSSSRTTHGGARSG